MSVCPLMPMLRRLLSGLAPATSKRHMWTTAPNVDGPGNLSVATATGAGDRTTQLADTPGAPMASQVIPDHADGQDSVPARHRRADSANAAAARSLRAAR